MEVLRILDVNFHVYEMNTPIGKSNELPDHFKEQIAKVVHTI